MADFTDRDGRVAVVFENLWDSWRQSIATRAVSDDGIF